MSSASATSAKCGHRVWASRTASFLLLYGDDVRDAFRVRRTYLGQQLSCRSLHGYGVGHGDGPILGDPVPGPLSPRSLRQYQAWPPTEHLHAGPRPLLPTVAQVWRVVWSPPNGKTKLSDDFCAKHPRDRPVRCAKYVWGLLMGKM